MNLTALAFAAAASIVPPQPTSFETVNLRMQVDSCTFQPDSVRVSMHSNIITVTQSLRNCFAPGTPQVVDVRLGAFPNGDYRVDLFATVSTTSGPPAQTLNFRARDPAEIAAVPAPARPLTDYTGLWYDSREPGWGLSLYQGATHTLFGLFFVYDANGQPEWYSLQGGAWTSSTVWRGTLFRTTGPSFWGPGFDPTKVSYLSVGQATLDFAQAPGEEGMARLSYIMNGVAWTKTIHRMAI